MPPVKRYLIQLRDKHPIIDKVLEYRSLKKLLSTYVEALPKLVKAEYRENCTLLLTRPWLPRAGYPQ